MTMGLVFFIYKEHFDYNEVNLRERQKKQKNNTKNQQKGGGFMEVLGVLGLIVLYKLLDQPTNMTEAYVFKESVEE